MQVATVKNSMERKPSWMAKLRHTDLAIKHEGFNAFMDDWQKPIYAFLRNMLGSHDDAADASQETFVQVLKSFEAFRDEASFATWIYTIARHKGYDLLRIRQKHRHVALDQSMESSLQQILHDPYFNGDQIQAKLYSAVAKLPPKQREVFILRYFQELPYESISAICKTSEGALKASYHHARKKIEVHLMNQLETQSQDVELNLSEFNSSTHGLHSKSTSNEKV